mmetsp:Transcript_10670/g.29612  ORF Transcript_10670/g.29612 Transcript_10670/m.29612 type:complete len:101 (+) Transcript_10670:129-431(+)
MFQVDREDAVHNHADRPNPLNHGSGKLCGSCVMKHDKKSQRISHATSYNVVVNSPHVFQKRSMCEAMGLEVSSWVPKAECSSPKRPGFSSFNRAEWTLAW